MQRSIASTNTSSQSRMPLWSNSERKARHMSLRTSSSYHTLRRRQQVEGFGYPSGRSFHLAPVLSTHSIPSNTKRSSVLGRPPFRPTDLFGIRGSIFFHCSSVLPPASQIYILLQKNKCLKYARLRCGLNADQGVQPALANVIQNIPGPRPFGLLALALRHRLKL